MTNQCYNFVNPALGRAVEAREEVKDWGTIYHVSVDELKRVGCSDVRGKPYPFYSEEVQVIKE